MQTSRPPDPASPWPCLSLRAGGIALQLAVVPQAKRTQVDGLHDGALRVRLAAPPVDGRANEALVAWLAAEFGVPRRAVHLAQGASSRRKRVLIDGVTAEAAQAWLEKKNASEGI